MNQTIPAPPKYSELLSRVRSTVTAVAIASLIAVPAASLAAPSNPTVVARVAAQNVGYIGPENGAALDLGFPVLVPSWVPGPFGGSPAIDAGGGYYSLYWMLGGGDPTFLQVTGQVGGGLPAGSPYDLNNQLFINSSVQGYDAIHDVTPAYDAVWWIAGGVLYKVESRNSSTDSLSLANSLITFEPPAAEPEPTKPPVVETPEPEVPDEGTGGESDEASTTPVTPIPDEAANGDGSNGSDTAPQANTESGTADSTEDNPTEETTTTSQGSSELSDGTGQPSVSSDGTGGARIPVIGGDGTGGTRDIVVPRPAPSSRPTP